MENIARIVTAVYALLMLLGGVMGYATKHSKPSLTAGVLSALFLGGAFYLSQSHPRAGFGVGAAVAIVLVIVFIRRIMELSAQNPPGSIGSNVGLCALSAVVAIFLIAALVRSPS